MKINLPILHRSRSVLAAFTLVEQLIGVSVVGVAITSLYAGFSSGFAVVQLARENLRAVQVLEEKMETIRLYTMDQITNTIPTNFIPPTFTAPFYPSGSTNTGVIYNGSLTITGAPIAANYSNDLL